MSSYVDGNYVTPFLVSNVVTYPYTWPNNSNVAVYSLEYVQAAANYVEPELGSNSAAAPSAYLIEKGPIRKIAPGYVRFSLTYTQVPNPWEESTQTTYTFPGLSGTGGTYVTNVGFIPQLYRDPITLYVAANVQHSYSINAVSPVRDNTFVSLSGSNVVDYIGQTYLELFGFTFTTPNVEPNTYLISSDVRLIRGVLWEKTNITVPKPA